MYADHLFFQYLLVLFLTIWTVKGKIEIIYRDAKTNCIVRISYRTSKLPCVVQVKITQGCQITNILWKGTWQTKACEKYHASRRNTNMMTIRVYCNAQLTGKTLSFLPSNYLVWYRYRSLRFCILVTLEGRVPSNLFRKFNWHKMERRVVLVPYYYSVLL